MSLLAKVWGGNAKKNILAAALVLSVSVAGAILFRGPIVGLIGATGAIVAFYNLRIWWKENHV